MTITDTEPHGTAGGITIRPIEPSDADALARLLTRLSPTSIYRRFFQASVKPSPSTLRYLATVDHHDREAVVAEVDGEIIGVARYDRVARNGSHEVAVLVEDAWQGHGIARLLLADLSRRARHEGIDEFTAVVLAENEPVRRLIRTLSPSARFQGWGSEREAVIPLVRSGSAA